MVRGHDQPDPSLIIQGSRQVQVSKRGQGKDYPLTALEELKERQRSKQVNDRPIGGSKLTFCIDKVTRDDEAILGANNAFFEAWQDAVEGGSAEKDKSKPDGDVCRPDGTLKDASEMDWPHSPSDSIHSNL